MQGRVEDVRRVAQLARGAAASPARLGWLPEDTLAHLFCKCFCVSQLHPPGLSCWALLPLRGSQLHAAPRVLAVTNPYDRPQQRCFGASR